MKNKIKIINIPVQNGSLRYKSPDLCCYCGEPATEQVDTRLSFQSSSRSGARTTTSQTSVGFTVPMCTIHSMQSSKNRKMLGNLIFAAIFAFGIGFVVYLIIVPRLFSGTNDVLSCIVIVGLFAFPSIIAYATYEILLAQIGKLPSFKTLKDQGNQLGFATLSIDRENLKVWFANNDFHTQFLVANPDAKEEEVDDTLNLPKY